MNLFRFDPKLEPLRNGTQSGDVAYFSAQWQNSGALHQREGRHHSAVFKHSNNPNMFLTPYAYEYFRGVLPDQMPKNSKVKRIVVATDLDAKFWHAKDYGPPADAFEDIIEELFNPDDCHSSIAAGAKLWGFFEQAFTQNMRHMPKALFFNKEHSTALVILSALQGATYHLKEMAGIGVLSETDFDKGEMHDAMMCHEWFHLSKDLHLSDVQIEIEADKAALESIKTLPLKRAWIDARIVGGFMWPFPGRQNGLALIDDKFSRKAFQEMQINVVHDWCEAVFERFFDSEAAAQLVSDMYDDQTINKSYLPENLQYYIEERFCNKLYNQRKQIANAEEFKKWFLGGKDQSVSKQAGRYLMQSYMMRLQVSNMRHSEFYTAMYELSEYMSPSGAGEKNIRSVVHQNFRDSLKRLLPEVKRSTGNFEPEWMQTQLPNVNYGQGPYIG